MKYSMYKINKKRQQNDINWRHSVFLFNFWTYFAFCFAASYANLELVNVGWEFYWYMLIIVWSLNTV